MTRAALSTGFSVAPAPSFVAIPDAREPVPSILDFLVARFPLVDRATWSDRLNRGMVTTDAGVPVAGDAPCPRGGRLRYFREVRAEAPIPFEERLLFQSDDLVVACKPHFLPVTPCGGHVRECLLYRLRERTGREDLMPLHRLDRETAGIVLFAVSRFARGAYGALFRHGGVRKRYEAVTAVPPDATRREWLVESRIVPGARPFLSREVDGPPNARTRIRLVGVSKDRARVELEPATGKRHQLRLHLARIGAPILNDPCYPVLQPEPKAGYDRPLQLLARAVEFEDPVTGGSMRFVSERKLAEWDE